MHTIRDDEGQRFIRGGPARRVVCLTPGITEALASVDLGAVVGATRHCTHPRVMLATRIGTAWNPDISTIIFLRPDVVVANRQDNRAEHIRRLRAYGIPVWVTDIASVPEAISSMERVFTDALGWTAPTWLTRARELWCGPIPAIRVHAAVPIWRDPWKVVGRDNFTDDLLRRMGIRNVFSEHPERYPHISNAEIDGAGADVILLPDRPYRFSAVDGPESFTQTTTQLISGRLLTCYGPSLLEGAITPI